MSTIANTGEPVAAMTAPATVSAKKHPSMNKSPWAKLISSTIPYTIVYPRAMRAYRNPVVNPVMQMFRKNCQSASASSVGFIASGASATGSGLSP